MITILQSQYYAVGKFPDNSVLFNFKQKIIGQAFAGDKKNVEIMVPLKYLSNFWRTLKMTLNNCEIKDTLKAYFC